MFLGDRPSLVYQYHPVGSGQVPLTFIDGYKGTPWTVGSVCPSWAAGPIPAEKRAPTGPWNIAYLYAIEKEDRPKKLSPEQVYDLRRQKGRPWMSSEKWLDHELPSAPPKELLGKAAGYTRVPPGALHRSRPDLILVENPIRPFVLDRKSWLFNGDPSGADAGVSAAMFSLIETAKANGLKSYSALRHLFEKMHLAQTEPDQKNCCRSLSTLPPWLR